MSEIPHTEVAIRDAIRDVLGAIVVLGASEGMTIQALDAVFQFPKDLPAHYILAKLGSVVCQTSTGFYKIFHASFYEFLHDPSQCSDRWYIDVNEYRTRLHEPTRKLLNPMGSGATEGIST